ncbi:sensor histidine kinase [Thiohalocapsa marina]|uniref:histidine kinase n=1 Tax=Thiohalocapsa marina TaxID=424902 RepID=A0A5M8FNQ8_9GAMM|nr:sensor histidine kinase [Thiohalocapsa marina]
MVHESLLQLRWLSVAAMALAAVASPFLLGPSWLMAALLSYAGAVGLLNLSLAQLARLRTQRGQADRPWFLSPPAQLGLDLLAWGGYLFLTGGATNPLISLFLPLVAIGALVLSPRQAWMLAAAAVLLYSVLWSVHVPLHVADFERAGTLHLLGMWLVFALSAVLVVGVILHLSDGIRRRDRALADAREQAIRDDWLIALGSQAASAAHALGTPLASLNILADDLLDDARLAPALAADVQAMKTELQRCRETLRDLTARADPTDNLGDNLSAGLGADSGAAPDAGPRADGAAPDRPPAPWLRSLVLDWRNRYPGKAVAFEWAIDPALESPAPLLLRADSVLERALANLLDNAVRAGASRIRITAVRQNGMLAVQIADNGSGMSPAALRAFARRRPQDSAAGLGVGLLLGRIAIERRGGSLTFARPDSGTGTVARLRLPLSESDSASGSLSEAASRSTTTLAVATHER